MSGFLASVVFLCASLLSAQDQKVEPAGVEVTIRARICDEAGKPLKDGCLVVGRYDAVTTIGALAAPDARCDADGKIAFTSNVRVSRGLMAQVMLITAPGKVSVRYRNPFIGRARTQSPEPLIDLGEIRLPKGHTMIGRVRQPDGKPVVGARVQALDCLAPYPWLVATFGSQAQTDDRGVFRMPGVFGSAMSLEVFADGFYTQRFASVGLGTPMDIRLEPSGFVEGVVLNEAGEPASGSVMVSQEMITMRRDRVMLKDGRFRVGVAAKCRFKLTAFSSDGQSADSELLSGPADGVTIRLGDARGDSFLVRAVDAVTGKPIKEIRASAFWFGVGVDEDIKTSLVMMAEDSSSSGLVALSPADGPGDGVGVLYVAADGYAPLFVEKVKGKAGGQYVAKLRVGAKVHGTVLDAATGKPAAGMQVSCRVPTGRRQRSSGLRGMIAPVVTKEDGAFAFPVLADGTYEIVARRATGTVKATKRLKVEAKGDLEALELTVPVGTTISGTIANAPKGAMVMLGAENVSAADDPMISGGSVLAASNFAGTVPIIEGKFRLPHRAARAENLYLVVPQPPRQGGALVIELRHLHIGAQDEELNVDCALHVPGTLAGKVKLNGADVPAGRLVVVAVEQQKHGGGWIHHDKQVARRRWCLLGTDGRYSIPLGRGSYTVEVIDSATGIELLRPSQPFAVVRGRPTTRDLVVDVVEVRAKFSVKDGLLPSHRANIICDGDPDMMGPMTLFSGGSHGTRGFNIPGIDKPVTFYVRPGTVKLQLKPGATKIDKGSIHLGNELIADELIEATLGKVHEVTVQLKPASNYPIE